MNGECIFCKIINGEIPSKKIFENDIAISVLDINPVAEGHCILIPKKHIENFCDLNDEEISEFFIAVKKISQRIKKSYKPDYVCIFSRGQRIPHAHIQIFPSKKNDELHGFPQVVLGKKDINLNQVYLELSKKDINDKQIKKIIKIQ